MSNKFRLIFVPAVEKTHEGFHVEAVDLAHAKELFDTIANYTLFLHDNDMMNDYSNTGWIEQLVDGEWTDVDEDEGE